MNDEDEFGKSPLGVSSKQRTQLTQHKNIDENEEGRGRRALNFSEATETQQGKDESTFGEQDLYGDLYGAGEGGEQKEGVGILRLKVSRVCVFIAWNSRCRECCRWVCLVAVDE